MSYEHILTDLDDDGILTVTLHRPEAMNAWTMTMTKELVDMVEKADANDDVRAVVVTGSGERAFCAGADLSSGVDTFQSALMEDTDGLHNADGSINWAHPGIRDTAGLFILKVYNSVKPYIGAINGVAVGVGVTMTLPMDIRIASDNARFGLVFSRRGIVPEGCSAWFLPRLVGISKALEWCYKGDVFPAQEALDGGLINEVVPQEQLLERAKEIARSFTGESAQVSIALTRQMMWKMLGADHPMEAHKIDSRAVYARGQQSDAKEGIDSFLEKRAAVYTDKPSEHMPEFYPWWDEPDYG